MRCWQFGLFLLFSLVSLDVWAQDLPDIDFIVRQSDRPVVGISKEIREFSSYQRVIVGAGNWEERSGEYPVFHYFRASGSAGPGESDKVT